MPKTKHAHWVPFNSKGFWTKFLVLVVAATLWLSGMAIISAGVLERLADPVRFANKNTLLVHIFPETTGDKTQAKTKLVVETLVSIPGVTNAVVLPKSSIEKIITPILGNTDDVALLPMPIIVKVTTNRTFTLDPQEVHARLLEKTTGVVVELERSLLKKMTSAVSVAQGMSWTIPLASVLVMSGIIALAIAGILFAHRATIEVLYNLGTYRRTIVSIVTRHILKFSLLGSIIGMVLAAITMGILSTIMGVFGLMMPSLTVAILFLCFPLLMVALAWGIAIIMVNYILSLFFKRA